MLYDDQIRAVVDLAAWYNSAAAYYTLSGAAGTGKSFVISELLQKFATPDNTILIAPTHKALQNLRTKTMPGWNFRTVASSLGLTPTGFGKDLKFSFTKYPNFWDTVAIAIVDEAGMLSDKDLALLLAIRGIKILFVGHSSQLPPIEQNRKISDPCVSPVFNKNFGRSDLTIPKRNVGKLWEFNNSLEQKIYSPEVELPVDFNISKKDLTDYLLNEKEDFQTGKTKIALWTNAGVQEYNTTVRKSLFGKDHVIKYIPGDIIIATNIFTSFDGMERMTEKGILQVQKACLQVYTDTDGVVESVQEVYIELNKSLKVKCFKLLINSSIEGKIIAYELMDKNDFKRIADFYEHRAWGKASKAAKDKVYEERAQILRCFAQLKHFYASTCHRLQGSDVDTIITIARDIGKNPNRIEKAKCLYVACSRAQNNLMFYNGV
jgi:hypothetical protein